MKVGLIARAEDRGLGNMTREWARHMGPDRTMIVRPQAAIDAGLAHHLEWFDPDAWCPPPWAGELPEAATKEWLEGLDVVYSAETFYDWRLCAWARELGVRTVCHVMPEYFNPDWVGRGADVWWAPTRWRLGYLPAGTEVVPVPIPTDRWQNNRRIGGRPRWLHIAGARAHADRNGTLMFLAALDQLRGEHHVTIRSQGEPFYPRSTARGVHVTVEPVDRADYWTMYADADALVLPRRYGGLSLPALEAMGASLALVMPEVEPQNSEWPIVPVPARFENKIRTGAGSIPICSVDPGQLAFVLNTLAKSSVALGRARTRSTIFATMNSWSMLRPEIVAALERACLR